MRFWQEIGVDLGTATVLIYVKGKGIMQIGRAHV